MQKWLRVFEYSNLTGIKKATIYQRIKRNKIKYRRIKIEKERIEILFDDKKV